MGKYVCVCACVCVGVDEGGEWGGRVEMKSSSKRSDPHRPQMGAGRISIKATYSTSGQS